MGHFLRHEGGLAARLEAEEAVILASLLDQLCALLNDSAFGPPVPDISAISVEREQSEEDLFADLEKQLDALETVEAALRKSNDPALRRLFPDACPTDAEVGKDFRRYTVADQRANKVRAARQVIVDLAEATSSGLVAIAAASEHAWLTTFTNLRLAMGARLGITTEADDLELGGLADDDPKSWVYSIYHWLGWMQESMLEALGMAE